MANSKPFPKFPTEIWLLIFTSLDLTSRADLRTLWSLRSVSRNWRANIEDVFIRDVLPRLYICLCLEVGTWPRPTHRSYATQIELKDYQFAGFKRDSNGQEISQDAVEYKYVSRPAAVGRLARPAANGNTVTGERGGLVYAENWGWGASAHWLYDRQSFGLKRSDIVALAREHDGSALARRTCDEEHVYCTPWAAFLGPPAPVGYFGRPSYAVLDEPSDFGGIAFPGSSMDMEVCKEGFETNWRRMIASWLSEGQGKSPVLGLRETSGDEFRVVRGMRDFRSQEKRPFVLMEADRCHRRSP